MAADNFLIGQLALEIDPQPRGVPEIEVTIDVDNNCICHITAEHVGATRTWTLPQQMN